MQLTKGMEYFVAGFSLLSQKGLKRFVFIPLLINVLLFGGSLFFLYDWLTQGFAYLNELLPDWLSWLEWLMWPIAVLVILFSYSMVFTVITNFIAAPFNGLLSEKVELHLTGQKINDDGFADLVKDVPRMLGREWSKLVYYLPRAIGFFILLWMLPFIGQILWVLFSCWMYNVQYNDYPFDNHKISFKQMKDTLKANQGLSYGFGFAVMVLTSIPIVNLIVMPAAVCGATKLWVENYRTQFRD
ncbi:sulfate transporter CysZ [Pseudoalteromonas rubra]|uniref:Sulfate transporter CysZ n=1 Tax=Pseudoalteromonas rubra TaxID=43658 RepID=A0A5S3X391_9GAMM|nr:MULTISPECIES: sulfate transporter CysZ [Pseudoalteromonas]MCO7188333.1 sulfate transporter CysZ [Pseudoalteromonas sp. XMcav2-N]TMP28018.1 sulfate transporter CysZ [Pseudoalteromonas rubra]TMP29236.1 sulfate transporter CysZ [Pseudoalteromonas rubra]TMP38555.1 sulfate transporter CysZ [Pseudoalteromonas rubra]